MSENQYLLKIFEALEEFWGFKLPKDYRAFLLSYKEIDESKNSFVFKNPQEGLGSFIDSFFFLQRGDKNILMMIKLYEDRIPDNFIPIGDDPGGNLILIAVKGKERGKIYFWDHNLEAATGEKPDYSNMALISDTFQEFLDGLHEYDDSRDGG